MRRLTAVLLLALASCSATPAQRAVCGAYLGCLRQLSPTVELQDRARYGEDAACWRDRRTAESCVSACEAGLHLMRSEGIACDVGGTTP